MPVSVELGLVDPTNTPEYVYQAGTNFPDDGYAFPSGGSKALYLKIGAELYGNSGNWTLDIHWRSRTPSTTGNVQWVAAMAAITPGDAQSVLTKALATSQNTTTTVNSTGSGLTLTTITISNLDSVNVGDTVWIKITRGSDTMSGDAIIERFSLSYSDGNSGTAGSGDMVGPASATNQNVFVANGTTGKLAQNCPVTIDNSGNMASVGKINAAAANNHIVSDGTNMQPKLFLPTALTSDSAAITTSATAVFTIALPGSGTYWFVADLQCVLSTTTANVVAVTVNFSGTTTRAAYGGLFSNNSVAGGGGAVATINTAVNGTPNVTSGNTIKVTGTVTVSTSGNLTVNISRATSGNIVVKAGSSAFVIQA